MNNNNDADRAIENTLVVRIQKNLEFDPNLSFGISKLFGERTSKCPDEI